MTTEEKVAIYEALFHRISMAMTAMNAVRVSEHLQRIDHWSYAHRVGNGELAPEEQQALIDKATKDLL